MSIKVWKTFVYVHWEGEQMVDHFDSEEKAIAHCERMNKELEDTFYPDYFEYSEVIVN